jgi:hypothetical protein
MILSISISSCSPKGTCFDARVVSLRSVCISVYFNVGFSSLPYLKLLSHLGSSISGM